MIVTFLWTEPTCRATSAANGPSGVDRRGSEMCIRDRLHSVRSGDVVYATSDVVMVGSGIALTLGTVSYTHLDVYKRQAIYIP